MDFVLIDNDIVTAHTERVARLSQGVKNLQDKMSQMFGYQVQDEAVATETVTEDVTYTEPVVESPVQTDNIVEEPVAQSETVVEDDHTIDMVDYDDQLTDEGIDLDGDIDLDLDLDQMIADMRLDDDELGL